MKRIVFLLCLVTATFAPLQAQEIDLGFSRFDILTADKDLGPFGDCKVYCEIVAHQAIGAATFEFADNLLRLIPGVDDHEAAFGGVIFSLGYGIGREVPQFFDTLWDDADNPGERRVDALAEALEHTTWAAGELSAKLFEFGDGMLANALERFVGVAASAALQYQLLPSRGLVPLAAPVVINP